MKNLNVQCLLLIAFQRKVRLRLRLLDLYRGWQLAIHCQLLRLQVLVQVVERVVLLMVPEVFDSFLLGTFGIWGGLADCEFIYFLESLLIVVYGVGLETIVIAAVDLE